MIQRAAYLGDAVYAVFDGEGMWLRLNDHENEEGQIYLEPQVLKRLRSFYVQCVDEEIRKEELNHVKECVEDRKTVQETEDV